MSNAKLLSLLTVIVLSCNGCATKPDLPTTSKDALARMSTSSNAKVAVSEIRIQMLRDTALSIGARSGLANRAKQLNKIVDKYNKPLGRVFNFYGMLLDDNVLPPVLTEGRNNLNLVSNDVLRLADRNYKILKQARFVTAVPSFKDYLILHYTAPESPDKTLLPKNKAEKIIWKRYVKQGWDAGEKQAEAIFNENIAKLTRDYNGMIRYRTLLAQNVVTPPFVANLDLGVTGSKDSIHINDRVLRITAKPMLNTDSANWNTTVTKHD